MRGRYLKKSVLVYFKTIIKVNNDAMNENIFFLSRKVSTGNKH